MTPTRKNDEKILLMLDMRADGVQSKAITATTGMTKGAIVGAAMRVRNAHVPCKCRKKANKAGGMPRGWWDA